MFRRRGHDAIRILSLIPHRQGVLARTEVYSLSQLLTRLGRIHSLFYHPHPLSKTQEHTSAPLIANVDGDGENDNGETWAIVTSEDFHLPFLQYCISNGFASLLYHYLDCYRYE